MNDLIANIDRVHTTDMGAVRVRRNLGLAPGGRRGGILPAVRIVAQCHNRASW